MRFLTLVIIIAAALLAACAGSGSMSTSLDPVGSAESPAEIRSGSFRLELLGEHVALGMDPAGLVMQHSVQENGSVELSLSHNGFTDLHGLALRLHYDELSLRPLSIERGSLLDELDGEPLEFTEMSIPGQLDYGFVQAGFSQQSGVEGSGSLLSVSFAAGPAGGLRSTSAAPASEAARTRLRISSNGSHNLNWFYRSPGDYDENGEVNVGDLTPLGQHFGESGDFQYFHKTAQIDGDGNGEINIADLTVIGSNYGRQIASYAIFSSSDPDSDYPQASNSPDLLEPLATIPHSDHVESSQTSRIGFSFPLDGLQPEDVLWVRPLDQAGNAGIASNRTDQPNGLEAGSSPVPFITADVVNAEVPFTVNFNMSDSYDPDGDELEFSVSMQTVGASYSTVKNASALASIDVTEPGNYLVRSIVHSGFSSSTSPPIEIIATEDGNHQPVAGLEIDGPLIGDAPFTVPLDMSSSTDADGDSLRYNLALYCIRYPDGFIENNYYVHDLGGQPLGEYVLEHPGEYSLYARVLDPDGLEDLSSEIRIIVTEAGNQAPHLSLTALGASGSAPLEVRFPFNAANCYDPDGEIVKYEFDPLGNGEWIEFNWENNEFIYTYEEDGFYHPRVRALDNDGLYGFCTRSIPVRMVGDMGLVPVADLQASETAGTGFLNVDFDASASIDPDGEIISYEVDFNNGLGWKQLGLDKQFSKGFSVGDHFVRLRVQDSRGNSDTHLVFISVEEFGIGF